MNQEQKKKPLNKWLQLINIPIQMGVVIFLFAYLGEWLDQHYQNNNHPNTKLFTMIGVFLALYNVIRQVNQLNKEE
ncbi:AtpZ/AtpI family protein [Flavobacterium filum]|uniref:AtpZ/AtpI family protein n=1 Tax=Flavobacterium TaxID=237 RepID=UPI00047CE4B3|nr:AtpZ/AtpI family protein [Flavobacterium filum]